MKKFFKMFATLTLGALLCGVLSGCPGSKDDHGDGTVPEALVGEWKLEKVDKVIQTSESEIREVCEDVFDSFSSEFEIGDALTVNADGTGKYQGEPVKFSVSQSTITITDADGDKQDVSYVISSGKLKITFNMKTLLLAEFPDATISNYINKNLSQFNIDLTFGR